MTGHTELRRLAEAATPGPWVPEDELDRALCYTAERKRKPSLRYFLAHYGGEVWFPDWMWHAVGWQPLRGRLRVHEGGDGTNEPSA